jgi:hypothetical protein
MAIVNSKPVQELLATEDSWRRFEPLDSGWVTLNFNDSSTHRRHIEISTGKDAPVPEDALYSGET